MALQGIPISDDQCIGDSLVTINNAFASLDASVVALTASKANFSVVDSSTIDLNYNSSTGTLSAIVDPNLRVTTLTATNSIECYGGGAITSNTAIGRRALVSNTTGYANTASGYAALSSNTTGYSNTASGVNALYSNTTGYNNVAVGPTTLALNLSGNFNTAVGSNALNTNTRGTGNTAIGASSLYSNTFGDNNVAVGIQALNKNTIGNQNIAIGQNCLYENTTGIQNTSIGAGALQSNTIGSYNTSVGYYALFNNSTYQNSSAFGFNAQVTGSNQIQFGDASTTTYAYGAVQNRSDIRDKADVRDTELGLEFVNALRPVDFKWDLREDYRPEAPKAPSPDASEEEKAAYKKAQEKWLEDVKLANITHNGSKKRSRYHHGLIAQEVKAVLDDKGFDFGGFQDHSVKGGDDVLSIGYEELIAPMLKAIQELSKQNAELQSRIEALENNSKH